VLVVADAALADRFPTWALLALQIYTPLPEASACVLGSVSDSGLTASSSSVLKSLKVSQTVKFCLFLSPVCRGAVVGLLWIFLLENLCSANRLPHGRQMCPLMVMLRDPCVKS